MHTHRLAIAAALILFAALIAVGLQVRAHQRETKRLEALSSSLGEDVRGIPLGAAEYHLVQAPRPYLSGRVALIHSRVIRFPDDAMSDRLPKLGAVNGRGGFDELHFEVTEGLRGWHAEVATVIVADHRILPEGEAVTLEHSEVEAERWQVTDGARRLVYLWCFDVQNQAFAGLLRLRLRPDSAGGYQLRELDDDSAPWQTIDDVLRGLEARD